MVLRRRRRRPGTLTFRREPPGATTASISEAADDVQCHSPQENSGAMGLLVRYPTLAHNGRTTAAGDESGFHSVLLA